MSSLVRRMSILAYWSAGASVFLAVCGCSPQADVAQAPVVHTTARVPIEEMPSDDELRAKLDEVVDLTRMRLLSPQVNNAWQVVHGLLAYGPQLVLNDNGTPVPALDYLLAGGYLNGWKFTPGEKGLDDVLDPGSKAGQGHDDQWLGYVSQCGVEPTREILWAGRTYTMADLVTEAQWDLHGGQEATWTLMGLSTYLPLDAVWKSKTGEEWTLERLLGMEAAQSLAESACGGSHRLYALSVALNRHLNEGGALEAGWKAADEKIQAAIDAAHRYQQPDGGFSVNFFQRSATSPDIGTRINTTGHVLEFLTVAADDEQLGEPWVAKAANYLCNLLLQTKDLDLECGGLYHAAHGLQLYRLRRFGGVGEADEIVIEQPTSQVASGERSDE